jgi:hypothetical protein
MTALALISLSCFVASVIAGAAGGPRGNPLLAIFNLGFNLTGIALALVVLL